MTSRRAGKRRLYLVVSTAVLVTLTGTAAARADGTSGQESRAPVGAADIGTHAIEGRHIARNVIRRRHIRDEAIGGHKIKPVALRRVIQRRISDRCPRGEAMVGARASGAPRCTPLTAGARGPQGPRGETGPRGPQGEVGPAGPATGPAGGDLTGSYPNPILADGSIGSVDVFTAALMDGAAGVPTLRSLGAGGTQAAAGNDARFPTAGQKAALAGSDGMPGAANPYVTGSDERLLFLPGNRNLGVGGGLEGASLAGSSRNTGVGESAGASLDGGSGNVLVGDDAGGDLTSGNGNVLLGAGAGRSLTTGFDNAAVGEIAGSFMTTGSDNALLGEVAGAQLTTGSGNVAIGDLAGVNWTGDESGNIAIGNDGASGENDTIRIGDLSHDRTFLAGVRGVTTGVADGVPVVIDSNGQLGTVSSSRRFKRDIEGLAGGADVRALRRLRPVSFRYREDVAPNDRTRHYGLIAEQVAKLLPELAVERDGKPYTVAYQELAPLLLAEVQRQDRKLERLTTRLKRLERAVRHRDG